MDRVFDSFEKMLIFIKHHEDWFTFTGEKLQRVLDLYKTGFLLVMKNPFSLGLRTILINHDIDITKFNSDDLFRLYCLVVTILSHDMQAQVCGLNVVVDFRGVTMSYLTFLPLKAFFEFLSPIKSVPMRYKNICIVGVPPFASQFLYVIKLGLSDTMLDRLHIVNELSDVWNHIDRSQMTEKYGGTNVESEAEEDFLKIIADKIDDVNQYLGFIIDIVKAQGMKNIHGNYGTFRKLEID